MRRSLYALISRIAEWKRSEIRIHAARRAAVVGDTVVGSWLACAALIAGLTAAAAARASDAVEITSVDGATTVRRLSRDETGGGGGVAGPLENGSFAAGLDAWSATETGGAAAPGSVSVTDQAAVLSEGDSFLVTLSQEFVLEPGAKTLSFRVVLEPGLDVTDATIPDAFEVSLLDAGVVPVVSTWDEQATSFLSFQESGSVLTAPAVTWDGERAVLDVSDVAADEPLTLYFDLIGADGDIAGAVRVDDVEVTTEQGFVRGNANLDDAVNITDPIIVLNYLFAGTAELRCLDAADMNNDGSLNITDPIFLLGFLFSGGDPIPPPYPECGFDVGEEDDLGCEECACPEGAEGGAC